MTFNPTKEASGTIDFSFLFVTSFDDFQSFDCVASYLYGKRFRSLTCCRQSYKGYKGKLSFADDESLLDWPLQDAADSSHSSHSKSFKKGSPYKIAYKGGAVLL